MSSSPALSPADSSQDAAEGQKAGHEQITFRFCSECSNMLYPKEDEENRCLKFVCRTCHYTEPAASSCVYRNVLNNAAGDTAGVTQDVTSDPTVGDGNNPGIFCCLFCGNLVHCEICLVNPADLVQRCSVIDSGYASPAKNNSRPSTPVNRLNDAMDAYDALNDSIARALQVDLEEYLADADANVLGGESEYNPVSLPLEFLYGGSLDYANPKV